MYDIVRNTDQMVKSSDLLASNNADVFNDSLMVFLRIIFNNLLKLWAKKKIIFYD